MRRRAVLRTGVVLAGVGGIGAVGGAARSIDTSNESQSSGYGPIASRGVPGAADCRVSPDGAAVYVAAGVGFVAVALPTMDELVAVRTIEADRAGGPLSGVADLAVDGDRLLVPGPANRRAGRLAGFALFDVGDPARPEQVAFHETDFPIHNAELADGRAYLTADRSLVVVDVTDDIPVEVARWSLADVDPRWDDVPLALWVLHDIRVRDGLAVLSQWDAGTWVVDIGDLGAVTVLSRAGGRPVDEFASVPTGNVPAETIGLPGNHHSSALSDDGTLLAIGAEAFAVTADERGTGPGGIVLYDITDPSAPIFLTHIEAPRSADETGTGTWTTAHDFAFDGDRLLSAWYQGGVRIHDVSDPRHPRELAWWRRPREAAFWTALPAADGTFVASSTARPADGLVEGVFLFPNRPGEQADPPSLTDPATSTPSHAPTETTSPRPTPTPGQPGLGHLSALGGLAGLAAWRRWRGR